MGDLRRHSMPILAMAIADNAAWLGNSEAARLIPISISNAVSETYVAVALVLGVIVNREKFRSHQYAGAALAIAGLIALAFISP